MINTYGEYIVVLDVYSELYGRTDCVVNVKQLLQGKRTFPCGDGNDFTLQDKDIEHIKKLEGWTI